VAASGKSLYLDELPEGYATRIESGLAMRYQILIRDAFEKGG